MVREEERERVREKERERKRWGKCVIMSHLGMIS